MRTLPPGELAEIHDLYARQAHAIDSGDGEGWAATFTPDGIFSSPSYPAPVQGKAALVRFVDQLAADRTRDGYALQHWLGNLTVSQDTPGEAVARAYLSLVEVAPGRPPRTLRNVWLLDRLVHTRARWRCARRNVALSPPDLLRTA